MIRAMCAVLLLAVGLLGCADPTRQKDDEAKISQLEQRVSALEKAKPDQPKHHYELKTEGVRVFRFDPDTGETCLQLTSNSDWKNPNITRQSCEYVDYVNRMGGPDNFMAVMKANCVFLMQSCDTLNKQLAAQPH